jgi:hypothetical protein
MCKENIMRCPHCHGVGPCVWVGFGKDWVLCQHCQRRVCWSELELADLVDDGDEEEVWVPGPQKQAAVH